MNGFNIGSNLSESYALPLALMGVKAVRIEVKQSTPSDLDMAQNMAAMLSRFGIGLIVYCTASNIAILHDWWLQVAERWVSAPGFLAYDIANELTLDAVSHQALMQRCINRIRYVDKKRLIMVQGYNGSLPDTWHQFLPPHGDNLIFSPHVYYPHTFTHQGLASQYPAPVEYPTPGAKDALRSVLQNVKNSGLTPITIGEFGVVRWAPGMSSYNYVRDCLDFFGEFNFEWLYHCWRAYPGWDAELKEGIKQTDAINTSPYPTRQETDTLRLLKFRGFYA